MSEFTKILDIDPDIASDLADAYGGYAAALKNTVQETQDSSSRASSLILAAVYRALVSPNVARQMFREAAEAYRELRHPYGRVLAICSTDCGFTSEYRNWKPEDLTAEYKFRETLERSDPTEVLGRFLINAWNEQACESKENSYEIVKLASNLRDAPIGRLRITFSVYMAAIEEFRSWRSNQDQCSQLNTFFTRAAEPILHAKTDKYHWRRLRGTFLPLEPEALAIGLVAMSAWRSCGRSPDDLLKASQLDPVARIPLEIAGAMGSKAETNDR